MARRVSKTTPDVSDEVKTPTGKGSLLMQSLAQTVCPTLQVPEKMQDLVDQYVGLPLDGNLALQYQIGVDVLPVRKIHTCVGETESFKSSFAVWMASLIMRCGGKNLYVETEGKLNYGQIALQLGYDVDTERFLPVPVDNMDSAINLLLTYAQSYDELCPNGEPLGLFLDSFQGADYEENITRVEEGGSKHAINAMKFAGRMKADMQRLIRLVPTRNIVLVVINHQKEELKQIGPKTVPVLKEPGGAYKEFAFTCKFRLRRCGLVDQVSGNTPLVSLSLMKNSSGAKRSDSLTVPYREDYDADETKSRLYWDWDYALAELLLTGKAISNAKVSRLLGISGVNVVKTNRLTNRVSSSTLGLKNVTFSELGAAIHADPVMVKALQEDILNIRHRKHAAEFTDMQTAENEEDSEDEVAAGSSDS
jgi:hypothetical protein